MDIFQHFHDTAEKRFPAGESCKRTIFYRKYGKMDSFHILTHRRVPDETDGTVLLKVSASDVKEGFIGSWLKETKSENLSF